MYSVWLTYLIARRFIQATPNVLRRSCRRPVFRSEAWITTMPRRCGSECPACGGEYFVGEGPERGRSRHRYIGIRRGGTPLSCSALVVFGLAVNMLRQMLTFFKCAELEFESELSFSRSSNLACYRSAYTRLELITKEGSSLL